MTEGEMAEGEATLEILSPFFFELTGKNVLIRGLYLLLSMIQPILRKEKKEL